ncbi:hypothetical protein GP486_004192 [Trichoglossum hirsutum]|uniref:Uncharacterized protein n=1 Tax=Trichoglossum hirsutum TaxID=265104 RepID=A0A9P8LBM6_9PEZI|nr:hypothetical protein GP486_004192 [Trichoglossum hirsutum]
MATSVRPSDWPAPSASFRTATQPTLPFCRLFAYAKKQLVLAQRYYMKRAEDSVRWNDNMYDPPPPVPDDIVVELKEINRLLCYVAGMPQACEPSLTPSNSGDEGFDKEGIGSPEMSSTPEKEDDAKEQWPAEKAALGRQVTQEGGAGAEKAGLERKPRRQATAGGEDRPKRHTAPVGSRDRQYVKKAAGSSKQPMEKTSSDDGQQTKNQPAMIASNKQQAGKADHISRSRRQASAGGEE